MKEALLYKKLENKKVACFLCAHHCNIASGGVGVCGVRKNINGELFTFSYGNLISANLDPIEKKPLFHFMPGSSSYSIAAKGCNFRCGFCQNWQISQDRDIDGRGEFNKEYLPENVVKAAVKSGAKSVSYTYTEPTIFFEYAMDIAKAANSNGLKNVFVTNGYMTADALKLIRPYLDAANIDLKSFRDDFYKKVCAGRLLPVLDTIRLMHELGIWIELTTLVIPGLNDSEKELSSIAAFIAKVDKSIPWHVSRFHPDYKLQDNPPTSVKTLEMAKQAGEKAGLRYVYIGNVMQEENTFCYNCGKLLIRRIMFNVGENNIKNAKCLYCNSPIDGVY
ncbi:MAG: AmmeMemoRadiSam system radical SAM enzyme [Candidatus Omnitrophica bacterium CG11_big_fil_rev_8_21_14_0_20_42_13]|uniref:AmmeMemoRadiSam system radical SAM enzyme n=1 Tax=Candidatus Ghiorseimicrobium undicola TaxID=1974746 RepID=A0A2H0LYT5_9BACT|nr:MAG: AmmeMemoRadiSam system radical SAM enzyme [Candidatus Omnitrophica bacterium CG11_big_fil_rev_8_21_14_0_20_42_13]